VIGTPGADHGAAGFFCTDDCSRWRAVGVLTFDNASPVMEAATALPLPSTGVVDCAGITAVDSAAVAVLLALKRRATAQGVTLAFVNAPASLAKLAELYDVEGILAA
jgi:phospholipid transport system transporter-binding protein